MRKSRFSDSQFEAVLKEVDAGVPVAQLVRKHVSRTAIFCSGRSKYALIGLSGLKRFRELEAEKSKLKRMYSRVALENRRSRTSCMVLSRTWASSKFRHHIDAIRVS